MLTTVSNQLNRLKMLLKLRISSEISSPKADFDSPSGYVTDQRS